MEILAHMSGEQEPEWKEVFMQIQHNFEYSPEDPIAGEIAAELSNVSKRYGQVQALNNVSFRMVPGELVALLGSNGAGKTTAVKLLLGLAGPNQGTIRIFGENPHTTQAKVRVGAMLQVAR